MMRAAFLPGNSTAEVRDVSRPVPGPGQVLLAMRASTICGSDVRAIYREHLGTGPEAYQGVVAGHEPCGEAVEIGPDVATARVGGRYVVYHISGCGLCDDCRGGYQISCTSPLRRAYGWQRDGGHAEFILVDERDLVELPPSLSFIDGACVACGFGTAYEALLQAGLSGRDDLVVTGLGPVGLAVGLLARKLGAARVVGIDPLPSRRAFALEIGAVTVAVDSSTSTVEDDVRTALEKDGAEVTVDASGAESARALAVRLTRRWGRCLLVGEGGALTLDCSRDVIHRNVRLIGSWVTSTRHLDELLQRLVAWDLHPEIVVTHRFSIDDADSAYRIADSGTGGKVAIIN